MPLSARAALAAFRDKRALWLSWLDTDSTHAIWTTLCDMTWRDVSFKALSRFAINDESNALNNPLVIEAMLDGHVAHQILAVRTLMDTGRGVISLPRLLNDIKKHWALLTRENFVCFDGLPYDYQTVERQEMARRIGSGPFWGDMHGPNAWVTSLAKHEAFDKLSGTNAATRNREDRLPKSLLNSIDDWLSQSGAEELATWSHAFLAHAADTTSRARVAHINVTAGKIADATKGLARVAEAIGGTLLTASSRRSSLMPTAQFNPFEKLDRPVMTADDRDAAWKDWHQHSDEWNQCLDDVDADLLRAAQNRGHETL